MLSRCVDVRQRVASPSAERRVGPRPPEQILWQVYTRVDQPVSTAYWDSIAVFMRGVVADMTRRGA